MTAMVSEPALFKLPDELFELIVEHLPPESTLAFGATAKRVNKITYEPLVWRRHCLQTWRYWHPRHEITGKIADPPIQTKWRKLFDERRRIDRESQELFDAMLLTQQNRYASMEKIALHGYDVKDLLLKHKDKTPNDHEACLAVRYHAEHILGQIHRASALEKWNRLANRQMVRLEEVLGAYDLFVLNGEKGDLEDIDCELDRLADAIKSIHQDWDNTSLRSRAKFVAQYLRGQNLVGNPDEQDYHALKNNFISMALFDRPHTSLPLQSVAIYCAVARRLGINARPSNYPQHVHAVIEAPPDTTLDGKPIVRGPEDPKELMHMDPWRSSEEVPQAHLALRLLQMGAPEHQHGNHLGPTTNLEVALRTGRNIMNSVHAARETQRGATNHVGSPDIDAAWYSMLWSMLVLGESAATTTLHKRRQVLPYMIEHFQAHFPEDMGLIEREVVPMFEGEREHDVLLHLIEKSRADDRTRKAPNVRNVNTKLVSHKIGTHFTHKRYHYEGIVVGWDMKCEALPDWIDRMRVDDLPGGRTQPFYNVIADDKSIRYVAAENIVPNTNRPCHALMKVAGKYFKRWDSEYGVFVNNIKDEYPDD